jgi:hypothetical protein
VSDGLTFVCWRWKPNPGYRSQFGPDTVRVLRNMIRRHYSKPHRFVCVTDTPHEIDADIETIQLWKEYGEIPSPHGPLNPSCYRRLKMFSPEAKALFGPRFVSMDLDVVIVSDLSPLVDRTEEFICWGDTNRTTHYNGSFMMLTAGARPQVWDRFDPVKSPRLARQAGFFGSDQGWISYCLGPKERKWSKADGVYSWRNDLKPTRAGLPKDARLVFFHGRDDPWTAGQTLGWVREHWR